MLLFQWMKELCTEAHDLTVRYIEGNHLKVRSIKISNFEPMYHKVDRFHGTSPLPVDNAPYLAYLKRTDRLFGIRFVGRNL